MEENRELIGDLLHLFWQRSSDACPLECVEAEKQEAEFKEWVKTLDFSTLQDNKQKFKKCLVCELTVCENHGKCLRDQYF